MIQQFSGFNSELKMQQQNRLMLFITGWPNAVLLIYLGCEGMFTILSFTKRGITIFLMLPLPPCT